MSCDRCSDLNGERLIRNPSELAATIALAQKSLMDGTITEISAGPMGSGLPLAKRRPEGPWDDVLLHRFRCRHCGQAFLLSCETYHGSGGEWKVEDTSLVQKLLSRFRSKG